MRSILKDPNTVRYFGSDWYNGVTQPVIVSRRFPLHAHPGSLGEAGTATAATLGQATTCRG